FRRNYANPLYRMTETFTEIFPVGVLVSLICAGLLRNSRFLPARSVAALCLGVFLMTNPALAQPAQTAGHITGIGGLFFKAKNPKTLAAWYRDVLGLPMEAWGGAMLRYDAPNHPDVMAWSAFPATTSYFAPSSSDFMINYAVDDMDALVAKLKAQGVEILKQKDDPTGRFAWLLDPEGNKVELWQPKR
ncbi:MAG TPA: VOC family protein, partial [Magnetospirillaceae bacterium]|nr:VOC family protein [Magnetospirillaceae bacterium]